MAADVVLDTNILLLPTQGIDLEDALTGLLGAVRMVVPRSVVTELATLQEDGGRTGLAASVALRFLDRCHLEDTALPGDDGVLDVSVRLAATLVTNDKRLQAEALRRGLAVAASRGRGLHLVH